MRYLISKNFAWFFVQVLLAILAIKSAAQNSFCRQGIFKARTEPLHYNVTKQLFVYSILECAHICRIKRACEAFKHRNVNSDAINCQITEGKPEVLTILENDTTKKWTLYILETIEAPDCMKKNLCNGVGRCLADSCEPDGFKCECPHNYYGKYCQYKIFYDYDINFPANVANNSIELGTIKMDINEFTFSAWIKLNLESNKYPLLSYIIQNSTKIIQLVFGSDDPSTKIISAFSGNLFGYSIGTNTIPINDGHWHHVGFAWSGITGEWILLIDGVLWGIRNALRGKTVPSGGVLTIGKLISNGKVFYLVGNISRVNLWSRAMAGGEIEEMAQKPGSRDGDLITWFKTKDFTIDERILRPSTAAFSGNGTNFEINLPLTSVSYPGLYKTTSFLSTCLWFYGSDVSGNTTFLGYDTQKILGISSFSMVSEINGFSSERNVTNGFEKWHFLCIKWNGIVGAINYYYDSELVGSTIRDKTLITELSPGKNFIIGSGDGIGKLTQLNIWDHRLSESNILVMTSGGFNIHGNAFSWSIFAKYVPNANINSNSAIYLPGFTVLEKRTKWCNDNYPESFCPGQLLARLGGHVDRKRLEWRCYCPNSLTGSKYTYQFSTENPKYYSRYDALISIN